MYLVKTPVALKRMYPRLLWNHQRSDKRIYLTFDDGPTPEITEWVLKTLKKHNAKATFFCIGNNIRKHPKIFETILTEDHAIGNHTEEHENGWETSLEKYIVSIDNTQQLISKFTKHPSKLLFRPPYGRIKKNQIKALSEKKYQVVMWDVLSADFDLNITPEKCLKNVCNNTKEGSIIVFHDSIKAKDRLQYALPKVLDYFSALGYTFERLY